MLQRGTIKAGLAAAAVLGFIIAFGASGLLAADAADEAPAAAGAVTTYETVFQAPEATRARDLTIENRAIALINATPAGERIDFAFRDFNRAPVVNALIAAKARGVAVRGVIDGGERNRSALRPLSTALGADLVFCGSDVGFTLFSCLADDPRYTEGNTSLQHNKFMLFSRLSDDSRNVVLETSMNFLGPQQLTYFNDGVVITGDAGLYAAYLRWVDDMMRQREKRTDDYYTGHVVTSDDGRATMFPSPRAQPDLDTNDTIAEQMAQIDCSRGGEIVAANQRFDVERAVIARSLARLRDGGCDVRVIFTRADAEILATLASAGIPATPFYWSPQPDLELPQVRVHNKFWLVDARSAVSGEPIKLAYVGSSNWRADEQYSDDLLLRVADDQVYAEYRDYWDVIAQRASSDLPFDMAETEAPVSVARASHPPNAAGWYRGGVTVRIAASDGHRPDLSPSGIDALEVELTGAQTDTRLAAPDDERGPAVTTLQIHEEGTTTITYRAVDRAGNREAGQQLKIRIDRTPPEIGVRGRLAGPCELWPPNGKMRRVGTVLAKDPVSGLAGPIDVRATSEGAAGRTDVTVDGDSATVALRAVKAAQGRERTYRVVATAQDRAGNATTRTATCVVPHSQGGG